MLTLITLCGTEVAKWREIIQRAYRSRLNAAGTSSKPEFYSPCAAGQIDEAEALLEVSLPAELRSLLLESDGVMDLLSVDGQKFFGNLWLIWPIEMMRRENLRAHEVIAQDSAEQGSKNLLFFASAGTDGILFGCLVSPQALPKCSVVAWYPMEDRVVPLAGSLAEFVDGWLNNRITV